ncbi:YebC/PmpR family DNA-binding transcriptional regulator [bacterium]|nr:YebC/PmpR family DNA-binding transcriptional regulator [bacterium]MBU4134288.1 YebC/PmpR family DNA-binding transcriptional regulator [bacterium]
MSGHSKWAGIKHKKAVIDAKRGKIFSKIVREINVACKEGGANATDNPRLRLVITKAKQFNMPADNIKRAIEKSAKSSVNYDTVRYEGYGPGGVAVMVEAQTDNRNRTTQEIKNIFSSHGGNFGEVGCVGWMFSKKGCILAEASQGEDKVMEAALASGADDIKETDEGFEVYTSPDNFEKVTEALKSAGIEIVSSSVSNIAQTSVRLESDKARAMLRLMDELENHDDVSETSANFDIDDSEIEKFSGSL